jgi:hypothetical protein
MDRRRPAGTMVRRLPACDWYVGCQPAKKKELPRIAHIINGQSAAIHVFQPHLHNII